MRRWPPFVRDVGESLPTVVQVIIYITFREAFRPGRTCVCGAYHRCVRRKRSVIMRAVNLVCEAIRSPGKSFADDTVPLPYKQRDGGCTR